MTRAEIVCCKDSSHFFFNFSPRLDSRLLAALGRVGGSYPPPVNHHLSLLTHSSQGHQFLFRFMPSFLPNMCKTQVEPKSRSLFCFFLAFLMLFLQIPLVGRPLSEVMQTCFENFPNETSTSKLNLL